MEGTFKPHPDDIIDWRREGDAHADLAERMIGPLDSFDDDPNILPADQRLMLAGVKAILAVYDELRHQAGDADSSRPSSMERLASALDAHAATLRDLHREGEACGTRA